VSDVFFGPGGCDDASNTIDARDGWGVAQPRTIRKRHFGIAWSLMSSFCDNSAFDRRAEHGRPNLLAYIRAAPVAILYTEWRIIPCHLH
jgi:hypothetical protein